MLNFFLDIMPPQKNKKKTQMQQLREGELQRGCNNQHIVHSGPRTEPLLLPPGCLFHFMTRGSKRVSLRGDIAKTPEERPLERNRDEIIKTPDVVTRLVVGVVFSVSFLFRKFNYKFRPAISAPAEGPLELGVEWVAVAGIRDT